MFPRALIVLVLWAWSLGALHAQTALREDYRIRDGGQSREFEVAKDEVSLRSDGQRRSVRTVSPAASVEAVRAAAVSLERSTGQQAGLVLYEKGEPRSAKTRRFLTRQIVVQVKDGTRAAEIAAAYGLTVKGAAPGGGRGFYLLESTQVSESLTASEKLQTDPRVLYAEPELARQQSKRFVPNDTYFTNQWHLRNTGQGSGTAGIDANLTTVWDNFKGTNVRIAIVDDGVQTAHPDLTANVDTVNDHDWNDATPDDPNPDLIYDDHGTSCAGVAAGRGNNGLGISGAAPQATLVGLRLIGAATTDSQEADAMDYKNDILPIKSNSWGPADDGRTLEGPGTLTLTAFAQAAQTGRGGKGTIILWAGGNGGNTGDNSNYDGYANSIHTIAVAALTNKGLASSYSEPGANLVVTAPSSGGSLDIVTTDLTGNNGYNYSGASGELSNRDYTQTFGGTSSATPLVAGCVALILEANPNLGWRDVQEILMKSATKVSATDSDWTTNGGGFHFNHRFGAGLINAQAAVTLAQSWTNLAAQTSASSSQTGINAAIPDNIATGITRSFNLSSSNLRVEHVTVAVSISHARRGQLAVTLTSPGGTVSRLAEMHSDTAANYVNWTFSTVRDWGESSQGNWTLTVADLKKNTVGTLNSATITVYGTSLTPVNQPPLISAASLSDSGTLFSDSSVAVQSVSATDAEGDTITYAYQWQQSTDNAIFADLAGETTASLNLAALSGKLVRCRITPSDATHAGPPFFTNAVAVNHRPNQLARTGQSYSYDSDLFLTGSTPMFRFGTASDLVPGLSIDPNTGVVSGSPNVPGGAAFQLVIERVAGSEVVSQGFTLLVADTVGNYVVTAGKTWTLNNGYTLAGNVTVNGTVDTAGHTLSVGGKITVAATATVANATGVISYVSRDGPFILGTTQLLGGSANDFADLDGDGSVSLLEFGLGMNPSVASTGELPTVQPQSVSLGGGVFEQRLALTYRAPLGPTGFTLLVEVSGDLIQWDSGNSFTEVLSDTVTTGFHIVTMRDRRGSVTGPRFIRLRAIR